MKNLFVWIHGIQAEEFNSTAVKECIKKVSALRPQGQDTHHISDWGRIVEDRQRQVLALTANRGNWLARKIRHYKCTLGLDMWMWLATRACDQPGDWACDIRNQLDKEIDLLSAELRENETDPNLIIVAHSWGTVIALDYFIRHRERKGKLVTLGSPAPMTGSACYHDWGNPNLLSNITRWVNIGTPNDPISELMKNNPNPAWSGKVEDHDLFYWTNFLPMRAHSLYFEDKRVHELIAKI